MSTPYHNDTLRCPDVCHYGILYVGQSTIAYCVIVARDAVLGASAAKPRRVQAAYLVIYRIKSHGLSDTL